MALITSFPLTDYYELAGALNGAVTARRGSLGVRSDAGNVSVWQNTDGSTTWQQLIGSGGGSQTFTADMAWTLNDNSATSWVIGTTGDTDMLTLSTVNGAESVTFGATFGTVYLDNIPLRFGTPGTDLVLTPNGTNVIVSGTGVLRANDDVEFQFGTDGDGTIEYQNSSNLVILRSNGVSGAAALPATSGVRLLSGPRTVTDAAIGTGSGPVELITGDTDCTILGGTAGDSGALHLYTGGCLSTLGTSGTTGRIEAITGDSADAGSGDIVLQTGIAATTRGVLDINVATMSLSTQAMSVTIIDNQALALSFLEGSNQYLNLRTSNGSERVESYQRLTTTDGVASGTARVVGGQINVDTAESTALTGAEALFAGGAGQETLPANTLKATTTVIRFCGMIRVSAVSGGPTAQIRIRMGGLAGVLCFDSGARTVADEDMITFDGWLAVRATGAAGTLTGYMNYRFGQPDALASAAAVEQSTDVAGSAAGTWATGAIDFTAAQAFVVTGQTDGAGTDLNLEFWRVFIEG